MNDLLNKQIDAIIDLCKKHYVKELYVIGSVTNKNFNETSDVDFLYTIDIENFPGWSSGSYDYIDNLESLEKGLKSLVKQEVDLVPDQNVKNKYMRASIDRSKQLIYAK